MDVFEVWIVFPIMMDEGKCESVGFREKRCPPRLWLCPLAQVVRKLRNPRIDQFRFYSKQFFYLRNRPHACTQSIRADPTIPRCRGHLDAASSSVSLDASPAHVIPSPFIAAVIGSA